MNNVNPRGPTVHFPDTLGHVLAQLPHLAIAVTDLLHQFGNVLLQSGHSGLSTVLPADRLNRGSETRYFYLVGLALWNEIAQGAIHVLCARRQPHDFLIQFIEPQQTVLYHCSCVVTSVSFVIPGLSSPESQNCRFHLLEVAHETYHMPLRFPVDTT